MTDTATRNATTAYHDTQWRSAPIRETAPNDPQRKHERRVEQGAKRVKSGLMGKYIIGLLTNQETAGDDSDKAYRTREAYARAIGLDNPHIIHEMANVSAFYPPKAWMALNKLMNCSYSHRREVYRAAKRNGCDVAWAVQQCIVISDNDMSVESTRAHLKRTDAETHTERERVPVTITGARSPEGVDYDEIYLRVARGEAARAMELMGAQGYYAVLTHVYEVETV